MAYCTLADIEKALESRRLIELTDDEGLDVVNQGRIDEAIGTAQGEVDGYLAERYQVPVSPVPALIRAATVDLAIYNLYSRKMDDEMPETRQKRYEAAIRRLEKIAAGKIGLGIATPPEESQAEGMILAAPAKVFADLDKY